MRHTPRVWRNANHPRRGTGITVCKVQDRCETPGDAGMRGAIQTHRGSAEYDGARCAKRSGHASRGEQRTGGERDRRSCDCRSVERGYRRLWYMRAGSTGSGRVATPRLKLLCQCFFKFRSIMISQLKDKNFGDLIIPA